MVCVYLLTPLSKGNAMMRALPCRWSMMGASVFACLLMWSPAAAQAPASAPLAAQLAELMSSADLDAVAGPSGEDEDRFVAALAFPGQLLVVSARYEVPLYVEQKLENRQFRDIYIDLNAASIAGTKVLVTDAGADGLHAQDDAVDMFDDGSSVLRLNGDWGAQDMSRDDYMQAAADADDRYVRMLNALIETVR